MYKDNNGFRVNGYDFFGLFAPGLLVLAPILICSVQIKYNLGLVDSMTKMVNATAALSSPQFVVLAIIWVIVAYIIGNIVASLSATLLEKMIVGKVLRYPFNAIIFGTGSKKDFSSQSYRSFTILLYITLWAFVIDWRLPSLENKFISVFSRASFCCIFGSVLVLFVLLKVLDEPFARSGWRSGYVWYHSVTGCIFKFVGSPFVMVEKFNISFLGQIQHLPEEVRAAFKQKYKAVFGRRAKESLSTEVFWSVYWYTTNNSSYIRKKTDSWLIQYGFMRNLSFAALLASIILVLPSRFFGVYPSTFLHFASVLFFVLSLVFAFRYYYLYFGYYSKTIFRAFIYLDCADNCLIPKKVNNR